MKFKYHRWFQALVVPLVALAFHIFFGYRVIGRENIPEGGCVVCPNHVQLSDPPFAAVALGGKTPIRLMAKKELFRKKIFAWLIAALGAFPIDREGADITAIKTALGSVRAGQKLIIFPQGTRHAAEGETKKGAAMLAVKTRAPILPMYITEGKRFRFPHGDTFGDKLAENQGDVGKNDRNHNDGDGIERGGRYLDA